MFFQGFFFDKSASFFGKFAFFAHSFSVRFLKNVLMQLDSIQKFFGFPPAAEVGQIKVCFANHR